MALTETSSEPELLAEFWRTTFLKELRANLYFDQFALKSTHGANSGVMAHWISLADLSAAGSLTEGTDPTAYALSAGDLTANLTQYGATVEFTDVVKDTWLKGSMEEVMERLARNASLTLDTVIRNAIFSAGGTVQYAGTAVARNSIATDGSFDADLAEFREASATLERANVMKFSDGFYVGIVHPDVKYDLMGDSNFTAAVQNTPVAVERLYKNEIGSMAGIRFLESTQALKMVASGSASTDVYQSYVFGQEYFGISELRGVEIIVKDPLPSSTLNLKSSVGWKALRAHKEIGSNRMIRLESGAALGT